MAKSECQQCTTGKFHAGTQMELSLLELQHHIQSLIGEKHKCGAFRVRNDEGVTLGLRYYAHGTYTVGIPKRPGSLDDL